MDRSDHDNAGADAGGGGGGGGMSTNAATSAKKFARIMAKKLLGLDAKF